jgi:hypothetical protein
MYVDEREGDRTYVAWTALQDISGDNGRLQVLPGSHLIDDRLRGSLLVAPWLAHEDVIRPRLQTLSVRAGDCVVLDNALVHCSLPNLTDEPRLVAAVAMKPRAAAPLHHRRFDDVSAATYEVDEDFWCDFTPSELEERPLPLPIARVVPAPQRSLTERHLASLLDHRVARVVDRVLGDPAGRVPAVLAGRAARVGGAVRPILRPVRGAVADRRLAAGARRRLRRAGAAAVRRAARRQSIVIVSWAPDDRPGTRCLRDIVHELRRRPGLRVSTWFVGASAPGDWPGARAVELRRWLPSRVLARLGAPVAAGRLRALRRLAWSLRHSWSPPDVIVYDDGVGTRFLPPPPDSVRVVRRNGRPPVEAHVELAALPMPDADLTLVGPGADARSRSRVLDAPFVRDWEALLGPDLDAVRARIRRYLGLDDEVVVVGTGHDGWLDGPELFVRTLWELERSHGIAAHGVWLMPSADHLEVQRLRGEADRCGVSGRLRFLTTGSATGTTRNLLCGDVGLLPCRTAGDPYDALALVRSGVPVVTFPVWGWEDPAVITVPHLDLVAAADAIATALTWDRGKLRAEAEERIEDLATWVDRFLDAVAGCRA